MSATGSPGRHRQAGSRHHGSGHGVPGGFGAHGNPRDFQLMLGRLEDPARLRWQRPARVVQALGLRSGQTVAEIGAGSGYFVRRLARIVGPRGRVYAVDVEPRMLPILIERLRRGRIKNVTPVLGQDDDPLLPARSCDLVLVVNTYHHFRGGPRYLRRLRRLLRPGGRLVNVDFHRRETPVGPPVERRVARETFLRDARRAGFRLVREATFLPYQYCLVLAPLARFTAS
jgi:ubiquinone/menaquinone biosynthesis C-methylase UbiE